MSSPKQPSSHVIGIDVGGTKIAAGLMAFPEGRALAQRTIPTHPARGGRAVLDDVLRLTRQLAGEAERAGSRVASIGLGLCELVDRQGNLASANCLQWLDQPVREQLASIAPIVIEADVRAAALAEALFGAGKGFRNCLYVTVGTGISCCLMLDGRPYLGARGATGTMASSPLSIPCEQCGQVSRRTLEEISAGPALVARFNAAGGKAVSGQEVLAAAATGDVRARQIVESASEALESQIGLLVNTLDPEAVVIGGGLGLSEGPYWDHFIASTRRHIWSELHRDLPILRAATGVDAGWIGAAARAWREFPNASNQSQTLKSQMNPSSALTRRDFTKTTLLAGAAVASGALTSFAADAPAKRIRVGIIGCGSVSRMYFPNLKESPHAEIVSACDIIPARAKGRAEEFGVPHQYPNIDAMLAGAPFDLLVNLTDMQEHERLNRQAIEAGKHVWSEKPIANSLAAGQELLAMAIKRRQRLWGAPTVVQSPQFAFMAKELAKRTLGAVGTAHASYGHLGPDWASFFYEKNGGSMPDLGVYQLTFLTGLFGPAKSVTAMTTIVTPKRHINGKGEITVDEEDNAVVVMAHSGGVISHVESSFNFFNPNDHAYAGQDHHTLTVTGRKGVMKLAGYDWGPHAVDLSTQAEPKWKRHVGEKHDYVWQNGASLAAECLATGKEPLVTPEHALHVVEIMAAARESQATGKHVKMTSTFKWPVVS